MPKSKKDPNKPKGFKTAYICFAESEKKEHEKRNEEISFTDLSKYCGAKWKEMDEDDKADFVALSNKDKERYVEEMESYIPPDNSDSEDERPKKKKKKEKDPNAPKRNMTAYFHFAGEKRPEIKVVHPNLAITEVAKKIGALWRALSEDDKIPYKEKAEKDKTRYEEDMREYNESK